MEEKYEEGSLGLFNEQIMQTRILIVTATKIEKDVLHKTLKPITGKEKIVQVSKGKHTYYLGIFGKYNVVHVACGDIGSIGRAASAITTSEAIRDCNPKIVIMIGIAFGSDKKKQNIGDVLVSERVIMYEAQRVGADIKVNRGKEGPASPLLIDRFQNVNDWKFALNNKVAKIFTGAVLSGEKLLDNPQRKKELLDDYPTAIGGEMEGSGIYSASDGNVDHWIMVKAICDYADGNKSRKKSSKQEIAATAAVDLCELVFNKQYVFEDVEVYPYDSPNNNYKDPKGNKELTQKLFELAKKQIYDKD